MISYTKECLCDVINEVEPLLHLHYEELTLNKDIVKLDPDWDRYAAMEHAGGFHVFTARLGDKLIGYSAFFLNTHLHYKSLMVAQNDVFYIVENHRCGTAAMRLIRYSEDRLRELGAQKVIYHAKLANNFAPILLRMGYADEEVMCGKML